MNFESIALWLFAVCFFIISFSLGWWATGRELKEFKKIAHMQGLPSIRINHSPDNLRLKEVEALIEELRREANDIHERMRGK